MILSRFLFVIAMLIAHGDISADVHDSKTIQAIDLSGTWKVRLDPQDLGRQEAWYNDVIGTDIQVPGIVTEAGLGKPLALTPELTGEVMQHLHQQRSYVGAAWFTRSLRINHSSDFENAILSIERVLWTSEVWVNGNRVGFQTSLCVPHEFDVGPFLNDGDNLIAIRVDNRPHVDIGKYGHAYTQQTQTIWNGLLGEIALTPYNEIDLNSLNVVPQLNSSGLVQAKVAINNRSDKNSTQSLTIRLSEIGKPSYLFTFESEVEVKPGPNIFEFSLPAEELASWSEFNPQRYRVTCELSGIARSLVTGVSESRDKRSKALGERSSRISAGNTGLLRVSQDGLSPNAS